MSGPNLDSHDNARAVIDQLTAIDGYDMAAVLEAVTGIGSDLFQQLDEKPGYYDGNYAAGDWHWKLRRARNWAPGFFDVINQSEKCVYCGQAAHNDGDGCDEYLAGGFE